MECCCDMRYTFVPIPIWVIDWGINVRNTHNSNIVSLNVRTFCTFFLIVYPVSFAECSNRTQQNFLGFPVFSLSFIFVSFQRYPSLILSIVIPMWERIRKESLAVLHRWKRTTRNVVKFMSFLVVVCTLSSPFYFFSSFPIVCIPLNSSKYHCKKKGKIDQCVRKKLRTSWCHEKKKGKEREIST